MSGSICNENQSFDFCCPRIFWNYLKITVELIIPTKNKKRIVHLTYITSKSNGLYFHSSKNNESMTQLIYIYLRFIIFVFYEKRKVREFLCIWGWYCMKRSLSWVILRSLIHLWVSLFVTIREYQNNPFVTLFATAVVSWLKTKCFWGLWSYMGRHFWHIQHIQQNFGIVLCGSAGFW